MWRSHYTADVYGHYDIWHRTYPDTDTNHHHNHYDTSSIQTIPPLSTKDDIRDTPCVSLHQKGRSCYNSMFLCDRPYSPFAGFYDRDDVYVGSEYDVFGGESSPKPGQAALSSSLTSTPTIDEEVDYHHHHHMDIFSDDPFSTPHLVDTPIVNRPSSLPSCGHPSSGMANKRIRTNDLDHATTTFTDNDHIMTLKRRKTGYRGYEPMDSSSTNIEQHLDHRHHHHELADYSLCIFAPDLAQSSPMPVDSMLEYN